MARSECPNIYVNCQEDSKTAAHPSNNDNRELPVTLPPGACFSRQISTATEISDQHADRFQRTLSPAESVQSAGAAWQSDGAMSADMIKQLTASTSLTELKPSFRRRKRQKSDGEITPSAPASAASGFGAQQRLSLMLRRSGTDELVSGGPRRGLGDKNRCVSVAGSRISLNSTFQHRGSGSLNTGSDSQAVIKRFEKHVNPQKPKTPETLQFIMSKIRKHRVRAILQDSDVDMIADKMQYYELPAGMVLAREGEAETHFFLVQEGALQIKLNSGRTEVLETGRAFGSSALLYKRAWAGTIVVMEKAGLWGINGEDFQEVLRARAQSRNRDNHRSLDSMELFNGLSVEQRDLITRAFEPKVVEAGSEVVAKGEATAPALYFVKTGRLRLVEQKTELRPGDNFGERVLLHDEPWPSTVVALERSELLSIQAEQLRPVLINAQIDVKTESHHHLGKLLEQSIVMSCLRQGPICSQYSYAQQQRIADNFQTIDFTPGEKVCNPAFVVVLNGTLVGTLKTGNVSEVVLSRGQWHSFLNDELKLAVSTQPDLKAQGLESVTAGPQGTRLGILTKNGLARALDANSAFMKIDSAQEALDYTRKLIMVRKLPILSNTLSEEQIGNLVNKFELETHSKGYCVFEQGSDDKAFYVVVRGEAVVTIGGQEVRTIGKNGYFGERSLLFDEPRTASVTISSCDADLWVLDQTTFQEVVTEKMREELMRRIRLQDTKVSLTDLRVVRSIGMGNSGLVRLVEHRQTHMRYALKSVDKMNDEVIKEIGRECAVLRENDHPFIMNVVKTFETNSRIYMLTELLTGGDMHGAIRTMPTTLSKAQAQFYTGSLVIVLEALWDRRILYRDLKPENVMLDANGYVKLIDFGISKKLGEDEPRTFTTVGTPHYMAPEVMSAKGYGNSADFWSLGVILFELVCGYRPFADEVDDTAEVFATVLKGEFEIPQGYRDQAGRELIQGLLCYDPLIRLGVGVHGFEELKSAKFFSLPDSDSENMLFNKIMGRELTAPVIPQGEVYGETDDDDFGEEDSDVDSGLTDVSEGEVIARSKSGKYEYTVSMRRRSTGSTPRGVSAGETSFNGIGTPRARLMSASPKPSARITPKSSNSGCCSCFAFLRKS